MTATALVSHFAPHGLDRLSALLARFRASRPVDGAVQLAADVAAVRSLARSLQANDPRMAADLSAAADRCEVEA